jgi:transcriptional regulator with PAS, ATPase and Fis domain
MPGVYTISLSSLRERGEDLPLPVEDFVQPFSRNLSKAIRK